jgi:hypothetical protein
LGEDSLRVEYFICLLAKVASEPQTAEAAAR